MSKVVLAKSLNVFYIFILTFCMVFVNGDKIMILFLTILGLGFVQYFVQNNVDNNMIKTI